MNETQITTPTTSEAAETKRPAKVLMVCMKYLPDVGGIETHVKEVASRLNNSGEFDVTVLTTDISQTRPRYEVIDGVRTLRVAAYPRNKDFYISPEIYKIVAGGDWDLVHQQGIHTAVPPIAMLAAARARIPYVTTFHTGGHSLGHRNALRGLQWRTLGPLLRRASALIGVSRFEADLVAREARVPAERVQVIRNGGGLAPLETRPETEPGLIISSGRLVPYKGHQRVIEALPHVLASEPRARLLILGGCDQGSNEPELRALAQKLGVADKVEIMSLPPEDRTAMAKALCSADIFVSLSEYEAHPVAVMEALSLGCTVVGLDVAGVGELVEEGWVRGIPEKASPQDVAHALLSAMSAGAGVDRSELPTWDTSADGLARTYRRILTGAASRAARRR